MIPAWRRPLLRLGAALAARRADAVEVTLRELRAKDVGAGVEEALLQSYLFVGYPAALNALALWREISGRPPPSPSPESWEVWAPRGVDVCRRVYGEQYEALRANVRVLHPDLDRWMVVEGYGKVLGRPGLGLVERELCIVAMLAVMDAPRQLRSHLRGALLVGGTEAEVEMALAEARHYGDEEAWARAEEAWASVRERHRTRAEDAADRGTPQDARDGGGR